MHGPHSHADPTTRAAWDRVWCWDLTSSMTCGCSISQLSSWAVRMLQCDDSIMNKHPCTRHTHSCRSTAWSPTHDTLTPVDRLHGPPPTTHSLLSIDCMVPHPPKKSDVSGSMGIEATVKTQDGGSLESTGLNRLDIVKHAIRTVATTLGETDTLAIVSFEASANVALPLTRMGSEPSKALVSKTLDTLHPSGGTNLWGGLEAGFALLGSRSEGVGVLLLLTDGQPNTCAHPGGELGALDDHLASQSRRSGVDGGDGAAASAGDTSVVVSTFGFGYDLDSALLLAIARRCGGSYTFVPDAGFVGELLARFFVVVVVCRASGKLDFSLSETLALFFSCLLADVVSTDKRCVHLDPTSLARRCCSLTSVCSFFLIFASGTAFVNAVAGCLTLHTPDVTVAFKPAAGVEIASIAGPGGSCGGPTTRREDGSVLLKLGPLHLGQPRDAVVVLRGAAARGDSPMATVTLVGRAGQALDSAKVMRGAGVNVAVEVQRLRLAMCAAIDFDCEAGERAPGSCPSVDRVITEMKSSALAAAHDVVVAMLADLTGQVKEAFAAPYFATWGCHYLRSLCRSHLLQQCANFKDPGLQRYGGALFRELRDDADELFCALPPPVAAVDPELERLRAEFGGAALGAGPHQPQVNMRAYHNAGNPCFHPDGMVKLANGHSVRVDEVRRGDTLASGGRVTCVLETVCAGGVANLCRVGGHLLVTPWHPVRPCGDGGGGDDGSHGRWYFPAMVGEALTNVPCHAVFNFLLDGKANTVNIDGVECITLAHGVHDDPVASHPFWGTGAVVIALARLPGFRDGRVRLGPGSVVRDPVSGLACGLACGTCGGVHHAHTPSFQQLAVAPAHAPSSFQQLAAPAHAPSHFHQLAVPPAHAPGSFHQHVGTHAHTTSSFQNPAGTHAL
jgi:hypothetical protein